VPENLTIKPEALEPLFAAWQEPEKHRVKRADGEGAEVRKGPRPSSITIAQNLRAAVRKWRDSFYFGVSETTRYLLNHWFGRAHDRRESGGPKEFRYYFCQREAIERFIHLKEVRQLEQLSQVVAEFGGANAPLLAADTNVFLAKPNALSKRSSAARGIPSRSDQPGGDSRRTACGARMKSYSPFDEPWNTVHCAVSDE
jgi:hypothetical protein